MEYLLKSSAVIFIFYTCYKLFLHRETFFESNRWFLLFGLLIAVIIPFIVIPVYIEYVPTLQNFIVTNNETSTQTMIEESFNFTQIFYFVYGIGVLFFLVKLCIEFSSLLLQLKKNTTYKKGSYTFIETQHNVTPFSFFKYIVYNKNQFNETELNLIINHEKVHANQFHSIDILLIHIISTLFWFNPFIWLYKKELQQNLEFIADKEAQTISNCEKSYQTLLLKSSVPNYQLVLANNFYNSLIKKRIVMLHKSKSNTLNVWKYALVLPVLGIFLMSANTKEIYVKKAVASQDEVSLADPSVENELNNILNSTVKNEANSKSTNDKQNIETNKKSLNNTQSKDGQNTKLAIAIGDYEMVVINKAFSDTDLEALKKQLSEKGITVKFKGIKRNGKNEIRAIKIEVSSKKSNANYHTESDDPIRPIKISFDADGGSIGIGNSNIAPSSDHAFTFVSKDGNHKIHTVGSADNVFVIAGDDEDEQGEKIIIKKADKVHFSPKANSKVQFISEDGNVTELDGENIVIRESSVGDIDTIHVKRSHNGNTVWITKENDDNVWVNKKGDGVWVSKEDGDKVIELNNGGENKFFISTDNGTPPLFILNGKEISKKEMDDLNPDNIEKVEVLKGDSATEKYGEKGENGVVLITTKDKK